MNELINALGLDWKMLVAQLVNFGILVAILYFFAYKPILRMLNKRSTKIEKSVKKADEIDKLLAKTDDKYSQKMSEAQRKTDEIIDNAKAEAEKERQEQLSRAREEADAIINDAKQSLSSERDKIISEIKGDIKGLVLATSKKVLQREVNETDNQNLIDETIKGSGNETN
ncbi:F0F1 ATP synthase subunit B [Patescibacteria group bacterium]